MACNTVSHDTGTVSSGLPISERCFATESCKPALSYVRKVRRDGYYLAKWEQTVSSSPSMSIVKSTSNFPASSRSAAAHATANIGPDAHGQSDRPHRPASIPLLSITPLPYRYPPIPVSANGFPLRHCPVALTTS